ncbi:MAG: AAA family ATPase [Rhodopirellula sp.]|nr:AAA family ATPase [Rhodopirellula sp.]
MFNTIEIENFKAFGEHQRFPLRPITLLFGANSSGKSSIIQSLLLLKQTLDEAENPDIALLPKGKLVNLGSFKEMVFKHDTARPLTITLGFSSRDRGRRLPGPELPAALANTRCSFTFSTQGRSAMRLAQFQLLAGHSIEPIVSCEPVELKDRGEFRPMCFYGPFPTTDPFAANCLRFGFVSRDQQLYSDGWNELQDNLPRIRRDIERQISVLQRHMEAAHADPVGGESGLFAADSAPFAKRRFERRPPRESREDMERDLRNLIAQRDRLQDYTQQTFIEDTVKLHESLLLMTANFLPTGGGMVGKGDDEEFWMRHRPSRLPWMRHGMDSPFIGACLTRCAELREMLERMLYLGPLREYPERHYIFSGNLVKEVGKSGKGMPDLLFRHKATLVKRVNEWLEKFGVDYSIDVRTVKDPDVEDVFTLRLTDKRTQVTVSPLDVGFGISQILPIVVQSLFAKGRVICVEQPEIHLHPRLQAEFGSLLAHAIRSKRPNQFIIETHSEHLILRLQRLIRNGTLKPEDVAVVHVRKTEAGSAATELRLDEQGEFIDRWPEGFFEEDFAERFGD